MLRDAPGCLQAWDDCVVLVVLAVAAVVILVGMIVVAVGRGGEMAEFTPDVRPVDADIRTAADVVLLRPSMTLWGYDKRSTEEALNLVARAVTERDVEIATLRQQVADMQPPGDKPPAAQPGAAPPGLADVGSPASPFLRRRVSPAAPPAETRPWSAWAPRRAAPPDHGDPEEPGETG